MKFSLASLLICMISPALAMDRYSMEFDETLDSVKVEFCFDGVAPNRLFHNAEAARFSSTINGDGKSFTVAPGKDRTFLRGLPADSCLQWEVDLEKATRNPKSRQAMRVGSDLVTDGDLWFWRGSGKRPARVTVKLPPGMNISVPWRLVSSNENIHVFEPLATPGTWASRIAIGHFDLQTIAVDGTQLRLAITGSLPADQQDKLRQWIHGAAESVGAVFGHYPKAMPQLLLVPIGPRGEAVPWAHVIRGGGIGAEFFVDETRSLEELAGDWTACHELSHMLLPFVSRRDRWLSEGVASYYQYVLLARSGKASEKEAWQGLIEGFRRGESDAGTVTLEQATLAGWDYTMRVYWSGAAMMLTADVQLRELSKGKQSLDTVLAGLVDCCNDNSRSWSARELFSEMDRISGTRIFTTLIDEHSGSEEFPELSGIFDDLGIDAEAREIRIYPYGPLSEVRSAIMRGE